MRLPSRGSAERRRLYAQLRRGFWVAFGLVGLLDLKLGWGLGIARSIPILFLISVYANYAGDSATAQGARTEIKADQANVGSAEIVQAEQATVEGPPE